MALRFSGKNKRATTKGQNRFILFTLFHTFWHFFRIFPRGLSPSKQRALAQGQQKRRTDNKKNWTNRFCTLVVARLSSSKIRIVRFEITSNRWRFEMLRNANRDSRHPRLELRNLWHDKNFSSRSQLLKVARLQSEFCTKDFLFELRIFLRKMPRNFPRNFILWVRKNPAKFPPNFPPISQISLRKIKKKIHRRASAGAQGRTTAGLCRYVNSPSQRMPCFFHLGTSPSRIPL